MNGKDIVKSCDKTMSEFIGKFLCAVTIVMITCSEFITEKLTISKYLERDRKGIINNIIISIFMMIFAVPMFIFTRYVKIE